MKLLKGRPENTRRVIEVGGGSHTVMDYLLGVNPYKLNPRAFIEKFMHDMRTGHKGRNRALWFLVDDLKDLVGLALCLHAIDDFFEENLKKTS